MCPPTKQELKNEILADHQEQDENVLQETMVQQQMELEHLLQVAENLKDDIMKLYDQEQQLIDRINLMKQSQSSLLTNLYSLVSNKSILFFVSGFLTGLYLLPTISKIFSSTRI